MLSTIKHKTIVLTLNPNYAKAYKPILIQFEYDAKEGHRTQKEIVEIRDKDVKNRNEYDGRPFLGKTFLEERRMA